LQPRPRQVVIIGGGIAGLTAAYALGEHQGAAGTPSIACTLVETAPRLGGKILTERAEGFIIEGGPDSFLAQKPWGVELCRRVGLGAQLIGTNPMRRRTFVLSDGQLREMPEGMSMGLPRKLGPFIRSGLLSWRGKLRLAAELFIPAERGTQDESLASFFRRRLGSEALDRLIEPLLTGIYTGDAERLSLLATFPRFREMEQQQGGLLRAILAARRQKGDGDEKHTETAFMTLRHGLMELVDSIAAKLQNTNVLTGRRAEEVRLVENLADAGYKRYDVRLDDGQWLAGEALILATPAYDAASLLKSMDQRLAAELRSIPYASSVTVSLGFHKQGLGHALEGYGFVVPRAERRPLIAATWSSSKWDGRAPEEAVLLRGYLGGIGREAIMDRTDEELIQTVRDEFRAVLGIGQSPILARVYRWPLAMPQYEVGHLRRLQVIDDLAGRWPGLFLAGAGYRGVGLPDCIRDGMAAAQNVVRFFDKATPRFV
jgi:protoporphyrinogen/coproporphyrinogen III oxidase